MNETRTEQQFHYSQAAVNTTSVQESMGRIAWHLQEVEGISEELDRIDRIRDELSKLEAYLNEKAGR